MANCVEYIKVGTGESWPVRDKDAQDKLNSKLDLVGGTMSGNIDMGENRVVGLGAPTDDGDAVPLGFANTAFAPLSYAQSVRSIAEGGTGADNVDAAKTNLQLSKFKTVYAETTDANVTAVDFAKATFTDNSNSDMLLAYLMVSGEAYFMWGYRSGSGGLMFLSKYDSEGGFVEKHCYNGDAWLPGSPLGNSYTLTKDGDSINLNCSDGTVYSVTDKTATSNSAGAVMDYDSRDQYGNTMAQKSFSVNNDDWKWIIITYYGADSSKHRTMTIDYRWPATYTDGESDIIYTRSSDGKTCTFTAGGTVVPTIVYARGYS